MNSAADENAPHPNAIQALMVVPSSLAFGTLARRTGRQRSGMAGATTIRLGIVAGFVLARMVSLVLIGAGRLDRRASVPLGSYLAAGAAVTVWSFH